MGALYDMGTDRESLTQASCSSCRVHGPGHSLDLLALHRSDPARYPHLLQSTAQGRFAILFAFPGESLVLQAPGTLTGPEATLPDSGDFLKSLDHWWQALQCDADACDELPFTGGWFIYLGYELAGQIESRLHLPPPQGLLPVAIATRFASAVIHDHARDEILIVTEAGYEDRLERIAEDIDRVVSSSPRMEAAEIALERVVEAPPEHYLEAIGRIQDYIREGDVFQVNLSREWQVSTTMPVDPLALYRRLRQHNPAPFSGIARWGDVALVSSSPERLVRVKGGMAEIRPIAGTRPRSTVAAADIAYSTELMAHPKERAEHIMLIDLERNDLGRISKPGTVAVTEFMVLESYAHVHHIVSNIRGELHAEVTPGEVMRAVFPGGTITGCPKVRCMEIIAELEAAPREAYTGSMGYLNRDGSMDLNILIRSMITSGDRVYLRAGAGIVADSVAVAELEETRAKARGMLRALGVEAC